MEACSADFLATEVHGYAPCRNIIFNFFTIHTDVRRSKILQPIRFTLGTAAIMHVCTNVITRVIQLSSMLFGKHGGRSSVLAASITWKVVSS